MPDLQNIMMNICIVIISTAIKQEQQITIKKQYNVLVVGMFQYIIQGLFQKDNFDNRKQITRKILSKITAKRVGKTTLLSIQLKLDLFSLAPN